MMKELEQLPIPLLLWYRENARVLPWRSDPTPYRVWISEIMLQQTRVAAVLDYYRRFLEAVPTVADLAALPEDALMKLWQGLGYYSRARNLQKAARQIVENFGGVFPNTYDEIRSLAGVGDYTAGAVASIAFGLPVPAVDGNVLRVVTRITGDTGDITTPAVKRRITEALRQIIPTEAPGQFNQAMMELGATVCLPNGAPLCDRCPGAEFCRARLEDRIEQLPVKAPKKARRVEQRRVYLIFSDRGVALHRRPDKGLLAGLWQPAAWEKALTRDELTAALAGIGVQAALDEPLPPAKHVFTHKIWELGGWKGTAPACALPDGYVWAAPEDLAEVYPVPNAFGAYVKAK